MQLRRKGNGREISRQRAQQFSQSQHTKFMKNKTLKKRKNTNTCYIAPHKHNHAKKKKQ